MDLQSKDILTAWQKNADPWIETLEKNEIKSRQLATNQAVLDTIFSVNPKTALDVGCGEGWLTRAMCENGIEATGIDGVKDLIQKAEEHNIGTFHTLDYESLRNGDGDFLRLYDSLIFNYAIFEKEETEVLFLKLKNHLVENGKLIIQTISDKNELFLKRPADGWMTENWTGLKTNYNAAFKWYYRSGEEWQELFDKTGFNVLEKKEIELPESKQIISTVYVAEIK